MNAVKPSARGYTVPDKPCIPQRSVIVGKHEPLPLLNVIVKGKGVTQSNM